MKTYVSGPVKDPALFISASEERNEKVLFYISSERHCFIYKTRSTLVVRRRNTGRIPRGLPSA